MLSPPLIQSVGLLRTTPDHFPTPPPRLPSFNRPRLFPQRSQSHKPNDIESLTESSPQSLGSLVRFFAIFLTNTHLLLPKHLLFVVLHSFTTFWHPSLPKAANLSFAIGEFCPQLKHSIITPLLKKPSLDKRNLSNYRPFSNLSTISKITERIVKSLDHFTLRLGLISSPIILSLFIVNVTKLKLFLSLRGHLVNAIAGASKLTVFAYSIFVSPLLLTLLIMLFSWIEYPYAFEFMVLHLTGSNPILTFRSSILPLRTSS